MVEGVYLHNLIFLALCTDTSSVLYYVIVGWSLPALFVVPWAASRVLFEDTFCWTTHNSRVIHLFIQGPTITSIVVSG